MKKVPRGRKRFPHSVAFTKAEWAELCRTARKTDERVGPMIREVALAYARTLRDHRVV